jgi:hypothetical protein
VIFGYFRLFYELLRTPKHKHAEIDEMLENLIENKFFQLSVSESGKIKTQEKIRSRTTKVLSPKIDYVLNCSFKNKSIQEEHCIRIDEEDNIDQESQEEDSRKDVSDNEDLLNEENFKIDNSIKIFFNRFPEAAVSELFSLNNILKKQTF